MPRNMQRHKPPPLDLPDDPAMQQPDEQSQIEQPLPVKSKVHFDWQDWLPYLEEYDCTEAQKRELIETYWLIILAFIDLDYEVGSYPAEQPVDKSSPHLDLSAALRAAVLQSENTETQSSRPKKEKTKEESA